MVRAAGLALVVTAACTGDPSSGVRGTPQDVRTVPGSYDGYDVVAPCARSSPVLSVVGRGGIAVDTVEEIGARGGELLGELGDVASLWGGGGVGLGCVAGVGTNLYVDDWRDVDELIERSGGFLRAHDLAMQVAITVDVIPEAN